MAKIRKTFTQAKETKGAVQYKEDGDNAKQAIRTIYLRKSTAKKLGDPEQITVTVEAA